MDGGDELPPCDLPDSQRDAVGCFPFDKFLELKGCKLPPDDGRPLCFGMSVEVRDKHGHLLDGDHDPAGAGGCDHRDTPEWKAEHPGQPAAPKRAAPKKEAPVESEVQQVEAPVLLASVTPEEKPALPTTESVGVDTAIAQAKSLVPGGHDASPALMIGGAATLAVVGAAIKFGPQLLKARAERAERDHELQMKKMEMEKEKQEKQEDQHQQCSAARGLLEAKVSDLSSKLEAAAARAERAEELAKKAAEEASNKGGASIAGVDSEELIQRLEKLEKAAKPAGKPGPKKR